VGTAPVLDLVFSQALVKVRGTVSCVNPPCPTSLTVQLSAVGRPGKHDQTLSKAAGFEFSNVLPGTYKVSAIKDDWCWEQSSITVQVSDQDVTVDGLVQSGFKMPYALSHEDLTVHIEPLSGPPLAPKVFELRKKDKALCLPRAGEYTITPQSCLRFENDIYQFNTDAPNILEFFSTGFEVQGTIVVANMPEAAVKDSDIIVHITAATKATVQGSSSLTPQKGGPGQLQVVKATFVRTSEQGHEFAYSFFSLPSEHFTLTPKAATLLFYPESRSIHMPKTQCPDPVPAFVGRDGKYMTGTVRTVNPPDPLEGVQVLVLHEGTEAAQATQTDKLGHYRIGPLYEDRPYQIQPKKKGYVFSPSGVPDNNKQDFTAERLSTIVVRVQDSATHEPLPSVFISLSGKGYRNNTATTAEGEQEFINLPPGTFFLRPLLKEYEFEPKTMSIPLEQGQLKEVEIRGKRVAFSCFGVVASLAGLPEAGVGVEARGADGQLEETRTNAQGQFRLRGLLPGTAYKVCVQTGAGHSDAAAIAPAIERASPEVVPVMMAEADITDLHFVAFQASPTFDLAGAVDCDAQFLDQMEVQLILPSTGAVFRTAPILRNKFFEMVDVKYPANSMSYVLRVSHSLPRHYATKATEVKVTPFKDGAQLPRVEVALSFQAHFTEAGAGDPLKPLDGLLPVGHGLHRVQVLDGDLGVAGAVRRR